jgi:Ni/Co efflux regulator RcnB
MKTLFATLVAVSFLAASLAHAADEKKPTVQQEKMKACNAQAGDKKLEGDARKAFMSDCLKAGMPASQQEKMKACNKDASAKALKGDERKAFMSTCLAGEKKS